MGHHLMGRFDTVGKSGLSGSVLLDRNAGTVRVNRLEFDVKTLTSVIELRDLHMKNDYLEQTRYPKISIENVSAALSSQKDQTRPFEGKLKVKDLSHPVTGTSQIKMKDEVLTITAEMSGKLSHFGIKAPTYMGIGVKDEFFVIVEFEARPTFSEKTLPAL